MAWASVHWRATFALGTRDCQEICRDISRAGQFAREGCPVYSARSRDTNCSAPRTASKVQEGADAARVDAQVAAAHARGRAHVDAAAARRRRHAHHHVVGEAEPARGIVFVLNEAILGLEWARVSLIVLVILGVVALSEVGSAWIRRRLT